MSKYLYAFGKIYTNFREVSYHEYEIKHDKENFIVTEWNEGDCIEFDDFEDIIRTKDFIFVPFGLPNGGQHYIGSNVKIDKSEGIMIINDERIELKDITEIWKRVSDTIYDRVCHKENGEWVID